MKALESMSLVSRRLMYLSVNQKESTTARKKKKVLYFLVGVMKRNEFTISGSVESMRKTFLYSLKFVLVPKP